MKRLFVASIFLLNPFMVNAKNCGRFSEPSKSILKKNDEGLFDFEKVTPQSKLQSSHCFYYDPRRVRCDVIYDGKMYFFFFSETFTKGDVSSGMTEAYFIQWLKYNDGKKVTVNTYNTLFEWDNDYEDVYCTNWYEQLTYTLTIDGKESVILE